MAQQLANKTYNTFTRGLITEVSELNFPPDASVDEDNCVLARDGTRRRRNGVDREASATLSAAINISKFRSGRVATFKWESVAGDAGRDFEVLQIDDTLYFHDLASDPVSGNAKSFTVDLQPYAKPGSGTVGQYRCSFATALGHLLVTSEGINPVYVTYNVATDEITVTRITIEFRDFEGLDDELENDEQPVTLSTEHHYNLLNQGWTKSSDFNVAESASEASPTDAVTGEPTLFFPQPYLDGVFNSYKDLYDLRQKDETVVKAFIDTLSPSEQEQLLRRLSPGNISGNLIGRSTDGTSPFTGLTNAQIVALLDDINPNWDEIIYGDLDPIAAYQASIGRYPANNVQWWAAKNARGEFVPMELAKINYGTGLAPRGHYILRATENADAERERVSSLDIFDAGGGGPLGPYTGMETETLLLLHMESAVDSGPDTHTVALAGNGAFSSDQVRFGDTSAYVGEDIAGSVTVSDDDTWTWTPGTTQTMEFWVYFAAMPSSSGEWIPLVRQSVVSGNDRSWMFGYWPSGTHTFAPGFSMFWSKSGTEFIIDSPLSDSAVLTTGQWYHIAVVWDGINAWRFYVDGCYTGFDSITSPVSLNNSSGPIVIGDGHAVTGRTDHGEMYVDEFRISSGRLYTHVNPAPEACGTVPSVTDTSEIDTATFGPKAVGFYAGRVAWAGGNRGPLAGKIAFSPVLEGIRAAGRCYQQGDPTAEQNSELLANDGLVLPIPGMGSVRRLFEIEDIFLVLADNGTWMISGGSGGFSATDFAVQKLSDVNCLSAGGVVDVNGAPVWWSNQGIIAFGFSRDDDAGTSTRRPVLNNLSIDSIQSYYEDTIPSISKFHAEGTYDAQSKKAVWLWRSDDPGDGTFLNRFDQALVLDVNIPAFYPWSFATLASNSPYVYGAFSTKDIGFSTATANVLRGEDQLQDSNNDDLVVDVESLVGRSVLLKFVAVEDQGDNTAKYTFAELNDTNFEDWATAGGGAGSGADFTSFAQAGYELVEDPALYKRAPVVVTFVRRSTDGGLTLQTRWEWADASASNRFSSGVECYKSNNFDTDGSGGFPIIVARHKVRGKGRAISMRFTSVSGKDFDLVGWTIRLAREQEA